MEAMSKICAQTLGWAIIKRVNVHVMMIYYMIPNNVKYWNIGMLIERMGKDCIKDGVVSS